MEIRAPVSRAVDALRKAGELAGRASLDAYGEASLRWFLYEAHQDPLDAMAALISELGIKKPPSYAGMGQVLAENSLVSPGDAELIAEMARNRNRLAHTYRLLDLAELREVYSRARDYIPRLAEVLLRTSEERGVDPPQLPGGLLALLRSLGVKALLLFGSRARGDYTEESDYDVAVLAERQLSLRELDAIASELSRLWNGAEVDVVDLSKASNELLYKALRDAVPLYVEDERWFKAWAAREYSRVLDEEDLMDVYYRRLRLSLHVRT
ncbi:DUF86 domain-containing protein [Infirmifilum lucidum]|uniref:DUF86 domain-containing protein n=1 Tax=Infirmifilum lucidum TaxID=2776706 RepID=A0A7L9FH79_9CREN|nr:nucleotidyltransferase domain-containing protein [Infirmifilum lucidum]QOJ79178.1 DUF86 domain-containing protein [Infirmifilum lucidum]